MNERDVFQRFLDIQRYIAWEPTDPARLRAAGVLVQESIAELIDDFYEEIQRHPEARKVITGGPDQVQHLKATLRSWLSDLFVGEPTASYVMQRWRVGWRHVEIGLQQIYVNAAMARLRSGILKIIAKNWSTGDLLAFHDTCAAVNRALDLDLAIIQDAYEEEKRQRSEAVFRNLIEAAGCAILILRDDLSVVYVNPFTERVSGFAARELLGQSVFKRLFAAENHAHVRHHLETAKQNNDSGELEIAVRCEDTHDRRFVWNARRLQDFAGSPAILVVGHDITELKQAQHRMLQAERLAAIGQTVAGLAHESRNAFQRMQACLEMLTLEVESQPEALELVKRIQRAQDHLHHLYEEVRSYAAPITIARQVCDMARLVQEVWQHLNASWQVKSLALQLESGELDTTWPVDRFAMEQVIRNILENAITASPAEGIIEVNFSIDYVLEQPRLLLSIRDHGPGIEKTVLPQVFNAFFTTKTKGTGLGMPIAKRIVEAHGGQLSVSNHAERGADFRVSLPSASK